MHYSNHEHVPHLPSHARISSLESRPDATHGELVSVLKQVLATTALLLLALSTASCSDDASGPASLTLATFNVRNFFDADNDPLKLDDVPNPSDVTKKIAALGAALRMIDADVIALQEVENLQILTRLRDDALSDEGYGEVRLVEGNDPRGIDVALLSRHPVTRQISHKDDHFPGVDGDTVSHGFSRDCLEVDLDVKGRKVTLLINHLRAKGYGSDDAAQRNAQAARVRAIADAILAANAQALLTVVGDLNDVPTSRALTLLMQGNPPLTDPTSGNPPLQRYTVAWGNKEQVDYLLLSPALRASLVPGSATAIHTNIFSATSDHFPVKAAFTLP